LLSYDETLTYYMFLPHIFLGYFPPKLKLLPAVQRGACTKPIKHW